MPRVTVICGGVGAARFLRGLVQVVDPTDITAIVNVGDDSVLHGLEVSPDLDTITYTLAGAIDPDPIKAHALDLLMDDLVPDFVVGSAAEAGLSKEQAAQAEALHAEWRATAFAHGKPPRFGMEIERMFEPEKRTVDLCAPDPR